MILKKYQVPGTVPSGKPPKSEPYRTVPCRTMQWKSAINLPLDAGEVLPTRQTLFLLLAPKISNPVERDIPGRFGNLSFQSTTGEVPPPGSRVSISRQMPQEPPGWTTSPFPPSSAKLTHQTGGHAHQLDVG